ncbi:hypothetical protein SCH01S_51_01060 [Sphingomonas changbaiensis NBRC 104936]|uniref:Lipoprotein n=2 Tax=Sphingomonas changbaiensis TaxID=529705 RepID=A0A0E9MTF8_9SPHN|nr:hypothetical protein SCH01S_51_01060 [Sphingomonas changbaiensis NBRC 104936]
MLLRVFPAPEDPSLSLRLALAAAAIALTLGACSRNGEMDYLGGIRIARTTCPAVGVPAYTGDITLFDPPQSRDARAIDVTATITNLRTTCDETSGPDVIANTTFDVIARRRDSSAPREVVLPYFVTIVRGGNVVVAKRISRVSLNFAAGQDRAQTTGLGSSIISRSAATLPDKVREEITRKRKAGEEDAAIDPFSRPGVRAAVARASFEQLIGFQLTPDQLQYNATR